jgi:hypothetical protein
MAKALSKIERKMSLVFSGWKNACMLEGASMVSFYAHRRQTRKDGTPYYVHPHAVAQNPILMDDIQRALGYLHDVPQKTSISLSNLIELGFSIRLVVSTDAMTPRHFEKYFDTAERINLDPDAPFVKIGDCNDNMDKHAIEYNRVIKYPLAIAFHTATIEGKIEPGTRTTDFLKSEHCPADLRKMVNGFNWLETWSSHPTSERFPLGEPVFPGKQL